MMLLRIITLRQSQISLATLSLLFALLSSHTCFCLAGRYSGTTLCTRQTTSSVTATTNLSSQRNLYTRQLLASAESQLNQNITGIFSNYTEEYEYHANTTLPDYSLQPEDNKCTSLNSILDAAVASCARTHQFCCIDSSDLQVRPNINLLCHCADSAVYLDTATFHVHALRHNAC